MPLPSPKPPSRVANRAHYNAALHIPASIARDPYLRPAFPMRNRLRRQLRDLVWLLLYRPSPRPLHRWRAALLRLFAPSLAPTATSIRVRGSGHPGTSSAAIRSLQARTPRSTTPRPSPWDLTPSSRRRHTSAAPPTTTTTRPSPCSPSPCSLEPTPGSAPAPPSPPGSTSATGLSSAWDQSQRGIWNHGRCMPARPP
jgi:hypothetical protein